MCSPKQLEANRLNAQHSTGPTSPEGKQKSSQNALKHGLCSPSLLPTESPEAYEQFCTEIIEDFHPQSFLEQMLAKEIAGLLWRLRRIPGADHHLFTRQTGGAGRPDHDRSQTLADSFINLEDKQNPFHRLQRYESHLRRALSTTLKQLQSLQKRRESQSTTDHGPLTTHTSAKLHNEPISPPTPPTPHAQTPHPPPQIRRMENNRHAARVKLRNAAP